MTEPWQRLAPMFLAALLLAAGLVLFAPYRARAAAPGGEQLYKQNGCVTCHAMSRTFVGPSLQAIAEKFAGRKDAVATLVKAVKDGHVGTWGKIPMPPHPNLPDETIKTMVEWILSLR